MANKKDKQGLRKDILSILEKNVKLTANEISAMEKEQIICGYGAFINWSRMENPLFTTLIEVKVTPAA